MFTNCSAYFVALSQKPQFDSLKLLKDIHEHPRYSYGDVSYRDFCKEYTPNKVAARKIFAIPCALFTGLIKSIAHLTIAIFCGMNEIFSKDRRLFKTNLFHAGRDCQEALGYLVTLFNERKGAYLIEQSHFHHSCYFYFFDKPPMMTWQPSTIKNDTQENGKGSAAQTKKEKIKLTKKIIKDKFGTLRFSTAPSKTKKKEGYGTLELQKSILTTGPSITNSLYEEMPEDKLAALTIRQVKAINMEQAEIISKRLSKMTVKTSKPAVATDDEFLNLTISQFRTIDVEMIKKYQKQITSPILSLCSTQQSADLTKTLEADVTEDHDLFEFREDDGLDKDGIIQAMKLGPTIQKIGKEKFEKWLKGADASVLSHIKVQDLTEKRFPTSQIRFLLMSDKELSEVTIDNFEGISDTTADYIKCRFEDHIVGSISNDTIHVATGSFKNAEDVASLTLFQLRLLTKKPLNACFKWLPKKAHLILSDEQIKLLSKENAALIESS